MRLTVDLINQSLSYLNPLKERELDLRGKKIPQIENLGGAKDHDAIDFTDNDITYIANFPTFPRLNTLLLAQNRVAGIHPRLSKSIPQLTTLVLTRNRLSELADLDPLGGFDRLTHLVLLDNPVQKKENYRYWVIWRCPSVRFLDYKKVKDAERERATEMFGTEEEPTALAAKIAGLKSNVHEGNASSIAANDVSSSKNDRLSRIKLSSSEKDRVKQLLRDAKTIQEIERLEKMLSEGKVPGGNIE